MVRIWESYRIHEVVSGVSSFATRRDLLRGVGDGKSAATMESAKKMDTPYTPIDGNIVKVDMLFYQFLSSLFTHLTNQWF